MKLIKKIFGLGKNMNATVGNNHTMSVTNDNMLLVQNNHTLEANNYEQTLQGNYNQSIQGKKLVAVTGDMEETSAAYYHTAQSGNVIIQSANISKLLGKVDAFVNKSGFQKPRYFIEDVSDKREEKEQIIKCCLTSKEGKILEEVRADMLVDLHLTTQNMIGKTINIDLSDSEIDFLYRGKSLKNDILQEYLITKNEEIIELKTIKQK